MSPRNCSRGPRRLLGGARVSSTRTRSAIAAASASAAAPNGARAARGSAAASAFDQTGQGTRRIVLASPPTPTPPPTRCHRCGESATAAALTVSLPLTRMPLLQLPPPRLPSSGSGSPAAYFTNYLNGNFFSSRNHLPTRLPASQRLSLLSTFSVRFSRSSPPILPWKLTKERKGGDSSLVTLSLENDGSGLWHAYRHQVAALIRARSSVRARWRDPYEFCVLRLNSGLFCLKSLSESRGGPPAGGGAALGMGEAVTSARQLVGRCYMSVARCRLLSSEHGSRSAVGSASL